MVLPEFATCHSLNPRACAQNKVAIAARRDVRKPQDFLDGRGDQGTRRTAYAWIDRLKLGTVFAWMGKS